MAPKSPTSQIFQTANTLTPTGTSFSTTNNIFYIKHCVELFVLSKLGTQFTDPDITVLANVFHTTINAN